MTKRMGVRKRETWQNLFADVFAQSGGPPTPAERAATRKELGLAPRAVYEKIAISLPSRAAEHVRRAVRKGEAKSVSAYITDAIEEKSKTETLAEMLDKMLEESGGPMTTAEARWADRKLGFARGPGRKRKAK